MAPGMNRWSWWRESLGSKSMRREAMLHLLRHRYVREKQHAMRYRQHAERMSYPQFRHALLGIAAEEELHAQWLAAKIMDLREKLPEVIPIHVPREQNSWFYLRTDLEEERRCCDELQNDLSAISDDFPETAALLKIIENDGKRHRAEIRDMLARSDPQAVAQE